MLQQHQEKERRRRTLFALNICICFQATLGRLRFKCWPRGPNTHQRTQQLHNPFIGEATKKKKKKQGRRKEENNKRENTASNMTQKPHLCNQVKWRVIPFCVFFFITVGVLLGVYRFRTINKSADDTDPHSLKSKLGYDTFTEHILSCFLPFSIPFSF